MFWFFSVSLPRDVMYIIVLFVIFVIHTYTYMYYMANIRYHHFLISRLRTTTKSNDLERSKSTIR